MRVKICGITRLDDALVAAQAGADALGFVFYPPSPRYIEVKQAADIIRQLPAFVTSVGLFVDPQPEQVAQVVAETGIDLLQFHGDETAAFCESFARPYIKALRVKAEADAEQILAQASAYPSARGMLLDAYVEAIPGGTGTCFDWTAIPADLPQPLILAGGLNLENVAAAARQPGVWALDVSGGVEAAKGIKSAQLIEAFMQAIPRPMR